MTTSVSKMYYRKLPLKIISYTDYKKFDNNNFLSELRSVFSYYNNKNLDIKPNVFFPICKDVLENHAPSKMYVW